MHLLIILLDQLMGMLRSARKARRAEVVVPRQNDPGGSDPAASKCLRLPGHGWMTVLRVWGPVRPPGGAALADGRAVHALGGGSMLAAVGRGRGRVLPRHGLAAAGGSSRVSASHGLDPAQAAAWFERLVRHIR